MYNFTDGRFYDFYVEDDQRLIKFVLRHLQINFPSIKWQAGQCPMGYIPKGCECISIQRGGRLSFGFDSDYRSSRNSVQIRREEILKIGFSIIDSEDFKGWGELIV